MGEMVIAFASLFLGLAVGPQPVALLVGDDVARVELRLDGETRVEIDADPDEDGDAWVAEVDFGREILPHRLDAVAFDAAGRELGRAEQWLNLPRPSAEARVVIDEQDGRRIARLSWESLASAEPRSVTASFDGRALEVEDPHRIELPAHDFESFHFLRVELDFGDGVRSSVEVALDGRFADTVATELTAVAIVLQDRKKLPDPAGLDGWFLVRGEAAEVVAVEEGPTEVVLVPELDARSRVAGLGRAHSAVPFGTGLSAIRSRNHSLRYSLKLRRDQSLRFVWPAVEVRQGVRYAHETFPISQLYPPSDGGVYWLLARMRSETYEAEDQRLADAVAVAGMTARGSERRRAVVFLTRTGAPDASRLGAEAVRRYLDALQVPLRVWSATPEPPAGWGETVDVSTYRNLERAVRALRRELDRQRIVFLRGYHLPQDVSLSPRAEGVRLAD